MLLIVQIVIAIWGLLALINGKAKLTRKKTLYSTPARIVGTLGLLQLILSYVFGLAIGSTIRSAEDLDKAFPILLFIQVFFLLAPFILGLFLENPDEDDRESSVSTPSYPVGAPSLSAIRPTWVPPVNDKSAYPGQYYGAASQKVLTQPGMAPNPAAPTQAEDGRRFYYPYSYPSPDRSAQKDN